MIATVKSDRAGRGKESAEEENREEADEARGGVYTKVKESARKDCT